VEAWFPLFFIIRLRSAAVSASLIDFRNASLSDLSGLQRPSAFEWEIGCCSSIWQMIRPALRCGMGNAGNHKPASHGLKIVFPFSNSGKNDYRDVARRFA
jgi:hypothetical protein